MARFFDHFLGDAAHGPSRKAWRRGRSSTGLGGDIVAATARLRVVSPLVRCAATAMNPATAQRDLDVPHIIPRDVRTPKACEDSGAFDAPLDWVSELARGPLPRPAASPVEQGNRAR